MRPPPGVLPSCASIITDLVEAGYVVKKKDGGRCGVQPGEPVTAPDHDSACPATSPRAIPYASLVPDRRTSGVR